MKNLKKLTYDLKRLLSEEINIKERGIKSEDSEKWIIANKTTGEERIVPK